MSPIPRRLSAVAILLAGGAVHAAPSFDCAKAKSDIEHTICGNEVLSRLDADLADTLKAQLNAAPDQRTRLLADERRWLKQRDSKCSGGSLTACLTDEYHARIAWLNAGQWKAGDQAFCQKIVDRYGPVAKDHPGEEISSVLARVPNGGLSIARRESESFNQKQLKDWGRRQKPAVTFSADFIQSLEDDGLWADGSADFRHVPNTPLYSISSVQGTAHCYSGAFFLLHDGHPEPIEEPADGSEGDCGNEPKFATLDGRTILLIEQYDWTPSMNASVSVIPWEGDHFGGVCTANFTYAPDLGNGVMNDWDHHCDGPDCKPLEDEAFKWVAAAQKGPIQVLRQAKSKLSALQLKTWQDALAADATRASDPGGEVPADKADDPSEYTDTHPLRVPFVFRDRLYNLDLGHFTMGWRVYGDWSAVIKRVEKGQLADAAGFAIGMRKGAVIDSSPKPSSRAQ